MGVDDLDLTIFFYQVTETYLEGNDLRITRTKTLCYDRVFGSSVVIKTRSPRVIIDVFCLSRKYSFFSMNFSFTNKPGKLHIITHSIF